MEMFRKFLSRIRILPLLFIFAAFSFALRLGDFMIGVGEYNIVHAAEETQQAEDMPDLEMPFENDEGLTSGNNAGDGLPVDEIDDWQSAADADLVYSETNVELFRDLAERRRELEKKERQLAVKEALLDAAEKELNQKIRELSAIRDEMKIMMDRQSEQADERIQTLVKVYEAMKPQDAARIFNTLDLDVLVDVLGRMSERKLSPILAQMDAERARTVTMLLAQSNGLPTVMR